MHDIRRQHSSQNQGKPGDFVVEDKGIESNSRLGALGRKLIFPAIVVHLSKKLTIYAQQFCNHENA